VIRPDADGVVAVMILGSAYREHLRISYTHKVYAYKVNDGYTPIYEGI
jgi:hypothetical protein